MTRTEAHSEFLPTRLSLISRLKDWGDQAGWREFFDTYGQFIFRVAERTGLGRQEAEDVVQETVLTVAKRLAEERFDASKGSFKGWLVMIVRSRVADHWRKKARRLPAAGPDTLDGTPEVADPGPPGIEAYCEEEWQQCLWRGAMEAVKARVSSRQLQVFDLCIHQGLPAGKVAASLGVSLPKLYLWKHRVAKIVKEEIERQRRRLEAPPRVTPRN